MSRTLKIQTPGASADTSAEQNTGANQNAGQGEGEQPSSVASTDGSSAAKPAKKGKPAPTRSDYAATPARDIDPATLTAPVLSRDGWVVPLPKPKD